MLDIVITHYKESWDVGEKLFRMIGLQRRIDFNDLHVTVINDGGHRLPDEKLAELPYPVEQVDIPHGGVSAARNTGIERTQAKWIMFCDFDDTFASIYSLRSMMEVLDTDNYDMLWCRILAEDSMDDKDMLMFVPELQRFVFCHGKAYRVAFLREHNVRFDTSLVFNEDSCFNAVIIARTPHTRIGEIKSAVPLYAWIRRHNSVTTSGRDDEAAYGHFRRNLIVTGEYEGTGDDRYEGMVTRTAYDTYYMTHSRKLSPQIQRRMQDEFMPWIAKRKDAFGKVRDGMLDEIRKVSKSETDEIDWSIPDDHEIVAEWVRTITDIWEKVV